MKVTWRFLLIALGIVQLGAAQCENVFLITMDGLRWQEVFSGAEEALISKAGGVANTNKLRSEFWRENATERRQVLMPFFWSVIAREGQLIGNREIGSIARVTNGKNFTYPGFNEILTGFADDRIKTNEKIPNPNVTVLEWLHRKPAFTNRVTALANWDVLPFIMNAARPGIPIWTGYKEGTLEDANEAMKLVSQLADDITPVWDGMNFDVFFYQAAREYIREKKPRVVWIAFSETDEWAHEGRYDLYLQAAHKADRYIKGLWELVQLLPEYRGKTAFVLTTDHGRGTGLSEWKNHGAEVKGAEEIWIGAIGVGVPVLGERRNHGSVGQNQIARTLASLLGENYSGEEKEAGAVIEGMVESK